jgi:histidinol-phosphatase
MSPRLQFAIEAAYRGGKSTLAHFQTGGDYQIKSDSSPLTIADLRCEELIRSAIEKQFPGEPILGEEQGGAVGVSDRWIIDPIDGTKSFVAGVPTYATLLSYEHNGEPILGVCYFPGLDEIVFAEAGFGTYWNGRKTTVTSRNTLDGCILGCGGPASMIRYGKQRGFEDVSKRSLVSRTWSDAYGHALVATGRIDAMLDPVVSRWDLSAMRIIVEEAGGTFTDFQGGDPFLKGDFELEAISSNGAIHDALLAVNWNAN